MGKEEFDFLSEVMGDHPPKGVQQQSYEEMIEIEENLLLSSYLLVNALLNVLIKKNYIKMSEVSEILEELHNELIKRRRHD